MAERKRELTVSFRPSKEQKIAIEKRVELSGLTKSNYIIRSCLYNRIVVVGKKENVKKIVNGNKHRIRSGLLNNMRI